MQRVITDYFPGPRPPPMATTHQHRSHRTTITSLSLSQLISGSASGEILSVLTPENYTMMMEMMMNMMMLQPLAPSHGEQDLAFQLSGHLAAGERTPRSLPFHPWDGQPQHSRITQMPYSPESTRP